MMTTSVTKKQSIAAIAFIVVNLGQWLFVQMCCACIVLYHQPQALFCMLISSLMSLVVMILMIVIIADAIDIDHCCIGNTTTTGAGGVVNYVCVSVIKKSADVQSLIVSANKKF